eukprot:TRINITY_DN261_c0_g4_i1.p1 TRINITY_DN261_c0_g4~~TRINITY_DN261_c0_g4_i1.p1  ORF type:complete len:247 (+),score=54.37 TRINITY_DN261_c0_g4_i1:41-742(+)
MIGKTVFNKDYGDVYIKESPIYNKGLNCENLNLKKLHPVLDYSLDYQKMSGEYIDVTGEKSLGQKSIDETKRIFHIKQFIERYTDMKLIMRIFQVAAISQYTTLDNYAVMLYEKITKKNKKEGEEEEKDSSDPDHISYDLKKLEKYANFTEGCELKPTSSISHFIILHSNSTQEMLRSIRDKFQDILNRKQFLFEMNYQFQYNDPSFPYRYFQPSDYTPFDFTFYKNHPDALF